MRAGRCTSFRKPAAIQHQTFFTVGFTFGMVRPSDPSRRLRRLMHNSNTDFIVQPSFLLCKCQKKSILYKQGKRKKLHTFMQHKTAYKAKIGEPYKDSPMALRYKKDTTIDTDHKLTKKKTCGARFAYHRQNLYCKKNNHLKKEF